MDSWRVGWNYCDQVSREEYKEVVDCDDSSCVIDAEQFGLGSFLNSMAAIDDNCLHQHGLCRLGGHS